MKLIKVVDGKQYWLDTTGYREATQAEVTEYEGNKANAIAQYEKRKLKEQYQRRIEFLKKDLDATDYMAIKVLEGAMTAEEFEPMRVRRQSWRDEINRLEQQIKNLA